MKRNKSHELILQAINRVFKNTDCKETTAKSCHCGATALIRVGQVGYCKKHKKEASVALQKIQEDRDKRDDLDEEINGGPTQFGVSSHPFRRSALRRTKRGF